MSCSSPLTVGADAACLIVCETTGRWAVALRREDAGSGLPMVETRAVAQAWEVLAQQPASFLVVELTRASAEPLLERMFWLEQDYPLARVAVVASRSLESCEWWVRAAGAVHFTTSPRQLAGLVQAARRHIETAPRPSRSTTEEIWAALPWAGSK